MGQHYQDMSAEQKQINVQEILVSKLDNKRRVGRRRTRWTIDVQSDLGKTVFRNSRQKAEDRMAGCCSGGQGQTKRPIIPLMKMEQRRMTCYLK